MARFPSSEWAGLLEAALNSNAEYAEAARAWEGDLLLLVTPDAAAPKGVGVHLDLFHGVCRTARYVDDPTTVTAEFTYSGSREAWARLFRGEIDPVQAILKGTFKIGGNLPKLMRFTRAATIVASTAASIPTDV